VVSFHCEPVAHPKAGQIVLTYGMTTAGEFQLREIQFAGSTEGHRIPWVASEAMGSRYTRQAGSVARENRRRGAALRKERLSADSETPRIETRKRRQPDRALSPS